MNKFKLLYIIFLPITIFLSFFSSFIFIDNWTNQLYFLNALSDWSIKIVSVFQILMLFAIIINLIIWFVSLLVKEDKKLNYIRIISIAFILLAILLELFVITINQKDLFKLSFKIILNIVLSLLSLLSFISCLVFNIIYGVKGNVSTTKKGKVVITKQPFTKPTQEVVVEEETLTSHNLSNKDKEQLVEKSFTSTPNEETFNISDKLSELKHNLHNNVIPEGIENFIPKSKQVSQKIEEDTQDETNNTYFEPSNEEQNYDDFETTKTADLNPTTLVKENPNNAYTGPIDPYKQTIVPRRFEGVKSGKYSTPIGNIAALNMENKEPRKKPLYDESYQGKIFLGDSDRIWDALKKQATDVYKIKPRSNLRKDITETVVDPLNSVEKKNNDKKNVSTIDWDD
ncbi:hypothetical protein SCORR_v1c02270 [Spiroplasma corruscae]|uniref:Uncharacterized protein n=1 Tax=Spiroplasma corruscae TaxID=216934 RepID=A0A222END6_9MOLU|nr:hypothetical protein [Spiroplasma corruscae]ASP28002.1 hypothetical protein SCORR_v1c02270 [Spiroplasma corruscae]